MTGVILFLLSLVNYVFQFQRCILSCFKFKNDEAETKRNLTYEKARVRFFQEYERSNPVTQHEETRKWIKWLKQQHQGNDNQVFNGLGKLFEKQSTNDD